MADKKIHARLEEMRGLNDAELDLAIAQAHKNIYQFRKDRLSKPQEDIKVVKNNRKEIARALTLKRQRQLTAAKEG